MAAILDFLILLLVNLTLGPDVLQKVIETTLLFFPVGIILIIIGRRRATHKSAKYLVLLGEIMAGFSALFFFWIIVLFNFLPLVLLAVSFLVWILLGKILPNKVLRIIVFTLLLLLTTLALNISGIIDPQWFI